MFNMAFADIIGFIEPGTLERLMAGDFGFEMTPAIVMVISIIQVIPIAMILFSRMLKFSINRWANILAGILTLLYITAGGSWDKTSYIVFGTVEIVALLYIVWSAWTWPTQVQA